MLSTPIRQHHLLMFDFGLLPEQHMSIVAENGITLAVQLINAETGAVVGKGRVTFPGKCELHFTASHKQIFEGLWYLQKRDVDGIWSCTCVDYHQASFCSHLVPFYPPVVA